MEKLRFETPSIERKKDALEYIKEFIDNNSEINGVGGLDRYLDNYEGWLVKLENDYNIIPNESRVPGITYFLVRESDNKIVGMINIRLSLNERLKKYGGHIGYSIRPTERRKGYNKVNLYLALEICKEHGIKEVFLDCDKSNLGSAKTMQALGGKLVREYFDDEFSNCIVQDYIIDVNKALEDYKDIYYPMISRGNTKIK